MRNPFDASVGSDVTGPPTEQTMSQTSTPQTSTPVNLQDSISREQPSIDEGTHDPCTLLTSASDCCGNIHMSPIPFVITSIVKPMPAPPTGECRWCASFTGPSYCHNADSAVSLCKRPVYGDYCDWYVSFWDAPRGMVVGLSIMTEILFFIICWVAVMSIVVHALRPAKEYSEVKSQHQELQRHAARAEEKRLNIAAITNVVPINKLVSIHVSGYNASNELLVVIKKARKEVSAMRVIDSGIQMQHWALYDSLGERARPLLDEDSSDLLKSVIQDSQQYLIDRDQRSANGISKLLIELSLMADDVKDRINWWGSQDYVSSWTDSSLQIAAAQEKQLRDFITKSKEDLEVVNSIVNSTSGDDTSGDVEPILSRLELEIVAENERTRELFLTAVDGKRGLQCLSRLESEVGAEDEETRQLFLETNSRFKRYLERCLTADGHLIRRRNEWNQRLREKESVP